MKTSRDSLFRMPRKRDARAAKSSSRSLSPDSLYHIQGAARRSVRNVAKMTAFENQSPDLSDEPIPEPDPEPGPEPGQIFHKPPCIRCLRRGTFCHGDPGKKCMECRKVHVPCEKLKKGSAAARVKQVAREESPMSSDLSSLEEEDGSLTLSEGALSSADTPVADDLSSPPAKKRRLSMSAPPDTIPLRIQETSSHYISVPSGSDERETQSMGPLDFRITDVPKEVAIQRFILRNRLSINTDSLETPSELSTISLELGEVDVNMDNDELDLIPRISTIIEGSKASAGVEQLDMAVTNIAEELLASPGQGIKRKREVLDFVDIPFRVVGRSSGSASPISSQSSVSPVGMELTVSPKLTKAGKPRKKMTEAERLLDTLSPAYLPENFAGRCRKPIPRQMLEDEDLISSRAATEVTDISDVDRRTSMSRKSKQPPAAVRSSGMPRSAANGTKRKASSRKMSEEEYLPRAAERGLEEDLVPTDHDITTINAISGSTVSSSTSLPDMQDGLVPFSNDRGTSSSNEDPFEDGPLRRRSTSSDPPMSPSSRKRKVPSRYMEAGLDLSGAEDEQERPKKKRKASESMLVETVDSLGRPFTPRPRPPPDGMHPQHFRCVGTTFSQYRSCKACKTKYFDKDECRFRGLRWFEYSNGRPTGQPFFRPSEQPDPEFNWPVNWNVPVEKEHTTRVKTVIARAMLPELRNEAAHLTHDGTLQRPRETGCRVTCDACATSLFSGSWLCQQCGRECCLECYDRMKRLSTVQGQGARIQRPLTKTVPPEEQILLKCGIHDIHYPSDFLPCSRFKPDMLKRTLEEMEFLLAQAATDDGLLEGVPLDPTVLPEDASSSMSVVSVDVSPTPAPEDSRVSRDVLCESGLQLLGHAGDITGASKSDYATSAAQQVSESTFRSDDGTLVDPAGVGSLPFRRVHHTRLNEFEFRAIWAKGETVVVTGLLSKASVTWSPEYFIRKHGEEACNLVDCDDAQGRPEETTVGEFFKLFGKRERDRRVLKLKDWPPTADFASTFPELYEDFHRIVPMPNYTRRDGVLNIASHFPTNAVPPDLGPKMYNAFVSSEGPGGHGSTRLHMDMADAVNVLLYAAPGEDGKEGVAAWDIFRSEDSPKIRQFMRDEFKEYDFEDPIHSQLFYLDSDLRRKLWDRHGVKSWRIYQQAGEAVFIPAGCAHQVCNLADAIKVAVDFISPENVDRCAKLTREFRAENEKKVWKEDVLALRSTMWYAWQSCTRLESKASEEMAAAQG